jgi:hypothetical protein
VGDQPSPRKGESVDARLFDRFAASLATRDCRRRILALLAALPLGAWLCTIGGVDEAEAAHPVRRVQRRAGKRRQRKRHRQDHRHDLRSRDNGRGNGSGDADPGASMCVPLDQICSIVSQALPCCDNTTCRITAAPFVTTCQRACSTHAECEALFGSDFGCVRNDREACPFLDACCRPRICEGVGSLPCTGGGPCCPAYSGSAVHKIARCCSKGQTCATFGGCASG